VWLRQLVVRVVLNVQAVFVILQWPVLHYHRWSGEVRWKWTFIFAKFVQAHTCWPRTIL
jgi:hypothetical protein